MENVLLSVISMLIGAGATILATRYYYRRSVEKELTPFLQFKSNVLDHIDDEVKSDLDIEYKGVRVERLQQVQFLIANTGERAIKEPIKPLSLHIDGEIEVMDANLLYAHPDGRKVNSPLKKAPLTGFQPTAKHNVAKAVSPSSETMRTI
jgi:hypothetical protein